MNRIIRHWGRWVLAFGIYLWYVWRVYDQTLDLSGKPIAFWWTWGTIIFGYFVWWVLLIELHYQQRQLRDRVKQDHLPPGVTPKVLQRIHRQGLRGVCQALVGPGPTSNDVVSHYVSLRHRKGLPPDPVLARFREVQYRLLIFRDQITLLALGAVLLFCAVVAYPFTSGAMLRMLAFTSILGFTTSVCICFWKLEKDEHLSRLMGSKPNEIEWNWNTISVFLSAGLMSLVLLLSQLIPGSWSSLAQIIGPIMRMGK